MVRSVCCVVVCSVVCGGGDVKRCLVVLVVECACSLPWSLSGRGGRIVLSGGGEVE